MRVSLFLFFVFFTTVLFGQASVDSLAIAKQVDSLIQVSRRYTAKGDFDKALEVNSAAEQITLEKLGKESAAYGSCAHNYGRIFRLKGNYSEAEKWCLEAISIRGKVLGEENPDFASSLSLLGLVSLDMGNYERAELMNLKALAIREKTLGKYHPDCATSMSNLANVYRLVYKFEKAELLHTEALSIRAKVLGKEHPDYAESLNSLAALYLNMGNYNKAEPLFIESLSVIEKVLGKENADYAGYLSNLAVLYNEMGNYEKAEPLYLKASVILEKTLGKEHPAYANNLVNLSNLYAKIGNNTRAEQLALEALSIREKVFGKEHPSYAKCLISLSIPYFQMGKYTKAEDLLLEALSYYEKVLGKEDLQYALTLYNLAGLYKHMLKYDDAERLFIETLHIREKILGKEHPLYVVCLNKLISLYAEEGNFKKIELFSTDLVQLEQSLLGNAVSHLSDRELNIYLNKFSESQAVNLSIAHKFRSQKFSAACYDNALYYKGFLLQTTEQLKRLALSNPAATEKFNLLKSYERNLAAQYTQPIVKRDSINMDNLKSKVNNLEKDLARSVAGYGEITRQVNWQEVQHKLGAGEAAVEFVHYQLYGNALSDSTMYAALILLPGNAQPTFVPLFEEKQLEALLKTPGARKSDYVNRIYTIQKTIENSLYELVWKPLEKALADTKTVYFSPSGLLHRLNLNAIPINDKETLSDRYYLVELGSTRQLVISSESKNTNTNSGQALLIGGVQYDLKSDSIAMQSIDIESNITGVRGDLNFSYTDSTDRGGTWNYLKWTDKEVTALEPILKSAQIQTTIRKGYTATEEAFKSIGSNVGRVSNPADVTKSPRILHIATHGYFFPDPKENTKGSASGIGAEPVFKVSDQPMIRSGLILAGGNHAWETGKPFKAGMEDGILTAYEISQMDLSNTELVVLSACETGLGDIEGNEGVYGLQRAFKIAGAKYLIMSLWQVPDFQTQELMTIFYTNWLTKKMEIPDAFRAAQQTMREKYEHPYFWAGFVLVE